MSFKIIPVINFFDSTSSFVYVESLPKLNDTIKFADLKVTIKDSTFFGDIGGVWSPYFPTDFIQDAVVPSTAKYDVDHYAIEIGGFYSTEPGLTDGSGLVEFSFLGEPIYKVNYNYINAPGNVYNNPQGLSIAATECNALGQVRCYASSEAKFGDNIVESDTNAMQLWNTDTNTQYTISEIVTPVYGNTFFKIWDLGFIDTNITLNVRLIGKDSVSGTSTPLAATSDFVNISIETPDCPIVPVTATASNDNVGDKPSGSSSSLTVSTNDTLCSTGASTFAVVSGSQVNVTNVSNIGAVFSYTPTNVGAFSFQYNILCGGVITSTATVSGMAITSVTADAVNDSATTTTNAPVVIIFSSNDTLCN
jgi:hypothetical protein